MDNEFEKQLQEARFQTGRGNLILANKAIFAALEALNAKIAQNSCSGACGCKSETIAGIMEDIHIVNAVKNAQERRVIEVNKPTKPKAKATPVKRTPRSKGK